jgi:hypothetical protein
MCVREREQDLVTGDAIHSCLLQMGARENKAGLNIESCLMH